MAIMTLRDLRPQLGPARNQGSRPTCIAFAFSDGHAAARGEPEPLSAEHLYYHTVQRTAGRDPHDGVAMPTCIAALDADGQSAETGWPYIDPLTDIPSWTPPASATPVFRRASETASAAMASLVDELDAERPTVVALLLGERFYSPAEDGRIVHGAAGVYDRYVSDVLPHVLKHPDCAWGTYAQRILCRVDADGKEFSPLKALVAKLKSQLAISGTNRGTYELGTVDPLLDIPIYDPASSDRNRPNGGPCLSHISVKLTADHQVMLTGVYRSHYWVQRTLGNLFGLAHLQHFIAQEAGLEVGPLICHSTMAQLETHAKRWNGRQVRDLVARCHAAHSLAAAA